MQGNGAYKLGINVVLQINEAELCGFQNNLICAEEAKPIYIDPKGKKEKEKRPVESRKIKNHANSVSFRNGSTPTVNKDSMTSKAAK